MKDTYYLNLFGNKYFLKDSGEVTDYLNNILVSSYKKTIYYKFCGRGFLNKVQLAIQANPYNPFSIRMLTKNYFDTCVNSWILDSIKNASVNKTAGFHVYKDEKKYSIYSFKVLFDSSEIEEELIDDELSLRREKYAEDYYPNFAEEQLKTIIAEYKNCNKFLLKDIIYVDVATKKKYKMNFSFLIIR